MVVINDDDGAKYDYGESNGDDGSAADDGDNDGNVQFNYPLVSWNVIQHSILHHYLYHNHQIQRLLILESSAQNWNHPVGKQSVRDCSGANNGQGI